MPIHPDDSDTVFTRRFARRRQPVATHTERENEDLVMARQLPSAHTRHDLRTALFLGRECLGYDTNPHRLDSLSFNWRSASRLLHLSIFNFT